MSASAKTVHPSGNAFDPRDRTALSPCRSFTAQFEPSITSKSGSYEPLHSHAPASSTEDQNRPQSPTVGSHTNKPLAPSPRLADHRTAKPSASTSYHGPHGPPPIEATTSTSGRSSLTDRLIPRGAGTIQSHTRFHVPKLPKLPKRQSQNHRTRQSPRQETPHTASYSETAVLS